MHDPIGVDKEGNEISLIDILESDVDDIVYKIQREIAKNLGVSRSYVSRIKKKAIVKLNKVLTQLV